MNHPPRMPVARSHDRLAVALGNASFLGIGYLMLRRRGLAAAAVAVTVVLAIVLASVASVWAEVVVLLWWVTLIGHGWYLAGRSRDAAMRRQWVLALAFTVPVLLAIGFLRFDASRIEGDVADARRGGDCAGVVKAQDRVWFGHRLADAPLAARGDGTADACGRLDRAKVKLATALNGDTEALKAGFDTLDSVLAKSGDEKMAETVLNRFLSGLPAKDPCHTAVVTDWLRKRKATGNALDRSAGVAAKAAPGALAGCGDKLMDASNWQQAQARYQQLLDQFPSDALTGKARDGVKKAGLQIELANVRDLLDGTTGGTPEYCTNPAKYSGAPRYGKGTNSALFFGNDDYTDDLPSSWRATDASDATLVVCADDEKHGSKVRTCKYKGGIYSAFPKDVSFYKVAIPVKVYELRTGKLVAHKKVQIGGSSCPSSISYTTYNGIDTGPPSSQYVDPSKSDVRDAFRSLIVR